VKPPQGGLGGNDILLIIAYLVLDVKDKFLNLFAPFLSLFQYLVLGVLLLLLGVTVNQIGVYGDEDLNGVIWLNDVD